MFHFRMYEHESLYGTVYTFPNVGDGLSMHTHTEEQKHNVMVMSGRLEIYGPKRTWCVKLKAGDVFDFTESQYPHEIAALEPNTVICSLFVHGKPAGESIPEEDRQGTIDRPLTEPQ